MEIHIGIQDSPREISFESGDTAAEIEASLAKALQNNTILRLSDIKGSLYLVPANSIAYLEIGSEETRRVGFVG